MGETTQEARERIRYQQTKRQISVTLESGERNRVPLRDTLNKLLADHPPRGFTLDVMIALTEIFHERGQDDRGR